MTNKYPHASILQYLIDGVDIANIESKYDLSSEWRKFNSIDVIHLLTGISHFSFRIKPKTVMFNGVELPMYETVPPKHNDIIFIPDALSFDFFTARPWTGDSIDSRMLERGLVFLKQEDAVAWGKATCPKTS